MSQPCAVCGYTAAERAVHGCLPGHCPVTADTSQDPARCLLNGATLKPRPKFVPDKWSVLETVESTGVLES